MKINWCGGYTLNRTHAVPEKHRAFTRALCGRRVPPFGWEITEMTKKQKRCKLCEVELEKQNKKP